MFKSEVNLVEINERIRKVRSHVGLSQAKFGECLGVSRDVINNLELGRVEPKDYIKKLICSEFKISESWLETGEGDMLAPLSKDDEFIQLVTEIQVSNDDFILRLLRAYWNLDDDAKAVIRKLVNDIADK